MDLISGKEINFTKTPASLHSATTSRASMVIIPRSPGPAESVYKLPSLDTQIG